MMGDGGNGGWRAGGISPAYGCGAAAPGSGLLHHSDRGTEFTSDRYQAALRELGIEVSMSRTSNCWDNAVMEAFFATLAKECVNRMKYQTRKVRSVKHL